MKVNLITVAMALAVALTTVGCCSIGCSSCKKSQDNSSKMQCDVGIKANLGPASAGGSVGTSGAHIEAKTGM